jgi:alpha-galactosidase
MNPLLDKLTIHSVSVKKVTSGLILTGPSVEITFEGLPTHYLYHGWQSWTLTAWVEISHPMPVMRPASMHPMQTDPLHAENRLPNGSWYGAVELADGQVILLGSLALESHVSLNGSTLTGCFDRGEGTWFVGVGVESEIFDQYASLLKERFGGGSIQNPQRIWCSWYSLYTEIYQEQLLKILNDLGESPFDVFQIDDGWQKNIGDWEPNAKFPGGMDAMADRIKATRRTAGLWLAPLLVVPSSKLFHQHRDWLLHDTKGRLVSAGFNWSEPLYALDTTHPQALEWLKALMDKVRRWGYDYVKLDFLYAGALPGIRHVDMPREAAYRQGLKVMRDALGDAYLLTCGAPILPSLGLCDGMRVGPDVAGYWINLRDRDLLRNFAIPGAQNALRTTLNRLWLKPLVQTDPDVVYFGSRGNNLTVEQKSLLQDLAQVAGFKATSEVPAWLSPAERNEMYKYMNANPTVEKTGRYVYKIGGHEVDFAPHIDMPPMTGFWKNWGGALLDRLAGIPPLMKMVDKISRRELKKSIESNPV